MRACPRGFSLIELVIVVVILSVITAIAMPRVSRVVEMSKVNRLVIDVRMMQTAAEMFDAEHDVPLGKTAAGTPSEPTVVIQRLLGRTHANASSDQSGIYGPYIKHWPTNSINDKAALVVSTSGIGTNLYGWRLDPETSAFSASVVGGSLVDVGGAAAKSGVTVDTGTGSKILDGTVGKLGG